MYWGNVIGRNGEGVKNDSGDRLLMFCAVNDMLVMNSRFQHKRIYISLSGSVQVKTQRVSSIILW